MIILAMDTSNSTCSAGVYEISGNLDNNAMASSGNPVINSGNCSELKELSYKISMEKRTHSETFMPLVHQVVNENNLTYNDIDLFAITVGPGSFTGIRIGVAAVKGMSAITKIKTLGISSTAALARSVEPVETKLEDTIIVATFDARNNRVFAAPYAGNNYEKIIDENAYDADELTNELLKIKNLSNYSVIVVGNGADTMKQAFDKLDFASKVKTLNYAAGAIITPRGVAAEAQKMLINNCEILTAETLKPVYCAKSQAERLRKQ